MTKYRIKRFIAGKKAEFDELEGWEAVAMTQAGVHEVFYILFKKEDA